MSTPHDEVTVSRQRTVGRWRWGGRLALLCLLALNLFYASKARRALSALELDSIRPARSSTAPDSRVNLKVPVFSVPRGAVLNRDGKFIVFEVQEGSVRAKHVRLGIEQNGRYDVMDGLDGGEILIARPPSGMQDGDPIRVKR